MDTDTRIAAGAAAAAHVLRPDRAGAVQPSIRLLLPPIPPRGNVCVFTGSSNRRFGVDYLVVCSATERILCIPNAANKCPITLDDGHLASTTPLEPLCDMYIYIYLSTQPQFRVETMSECNMLRSSDLMMKKLEELIEYDAN